VSTKPEDFTNLACQYFQRGNDGFVSFWLWILKEDLYIWRLPVLTILAHCKHHFRSCFSKWTPSNAFLWIRMLGLKIPRPSCSCAGFRNSEGGAGQGGEAELQRQGHRAEARRPGHCCHHELHKHLKPHGDAGCGSGRKEGGREGPVCRPSHQDQSGTRVWSGHSLPQDQVRKQGLAMLKFSLLYLRL
jgi:hypothetical protein